MAILHLFLSCQNTDMSVSLLLFFSDLFSRTKRSIISEESSEMGNLKTWREMQRLVLYKQQTTGRDEKAGKFQERDNVRAREPISSLPFKMAYNFAIKIPIRESRTLAASLCGGGGVLHRYKPRNTIAFVSPEIQGMDSVNRIGIQPCHTTEAQLFHASQ
jgi:hypothetical protein